MKVYWFFDSDSPDKAFFKYGKRKPTDHWCMFTTKLGAYSHAYEMILVENYIEEDEFLPDDASLEQYQKLFSEYGFNLEDGSGFAQIIEIEVREDRGHIVEVLK